jgi:alcohol dehydrogenase (NADP+)
MGIEAQTGRPTYGGYSDTIVVDRHFVLRMPAGVDLASTAPLLCAGITTYSPLRHWGAGPRQARGRQRTWAAWATWPSSSRRRWAPR